MSEPTMNEDQFRRFMSEIAPTLNVSMLSRGAFWQKMLDPRRNVDAECGYPSYLQLTPDNFRDWFEYEPIARRIVELMPKECCQIPVSYTHLTLPTILRV